MGAKLREISMFFKNNASAAAGRKRIDLKDTILLDNPTLTDADLDREIIQISKVFSVEKLKSTSSGESTKEKMAHFEVRSGFDIGNRAGFIFPNATYFYYDNLASKIESKILYLFQDAAGDQPSCKVKIKNGSEVLKAPSDIGALYENREIITYTYKHP